MVKYNTGLRDAHLIGKIVERAIVVTAGGKLQIDRADLAMDITAAHANGCPLRLEALLEAKDFDFLHDVLGIRCNIDRTTGKLPAWWCPRYAAAEGVGP